MTCRVVWYEKKYMETDIRYLMRVDTCCNQPWKEINERIFWKE